MTWTLAVPVIAALVYGLAAILQTVGAQRGGGEPGMRGLTMILRQMPFLWGLGLDMFGWILTMYSVRHLPLFTVQTTLASSLAVTALLARFILHIRLRRLDAAAIGVIIVGLILVGASATEGTGDSLQTVYQVMLVGFVPVGVALCLHIFRQGRPIAAGAAAGLMFALSAMRARAVEEPDGFDDLLRQPIAWAVVGYALAGLAIHARALECGRVGPVTAAMWSTEIVVATSAGFLVLGDRVRPGWAIPAALGVIATLAATRVLANSPAHESDGVPTPVG